MVAAILASFVSFLDGSVVNVALPAIQRDLGGGLAAQQWIVDAYLLSLGSLILIAGSLSDLYGRQRILAGGLIGFLIASLGCAVAPNVLVLIGARFVQGMAGALLVPSSLALIMSNFRGDAEGRAIGTWTAWTGISTVFGPVLGGFLVDASSWRWVFAINVLPIAVTLVLLAMMEPEEHQPHGRVDWRGATLCALGLGGPVFALIEQPTRGWSDPLIWAPLAGGLILLAAFVVWEWRCPHPMLPLQLFRNRTFTVGNLATLAIYGGLSAVTFILVVFLQQVAGWSALSAGLAFVPVTIVMFLLSSRVGALATRMGPRLFMGFGPLVGAAGFLLLLRMGSHPNYWIDLLPSVLLFAFGLTLTVAPLTAAILGDVPTQESGIASAVNNAVARVAGLIAVAFVGAIVAAAFTASLNSRIERQGGGSAERSAAARAAPMVTSPPPGLEHHQRFREDLVAAGVDGFHATVVTVVILLGAGGVISLIGIPSRRTT
ncbi:MAG: MFS transporter [Candidatus Dormibacteraeota bacterium]|nr:MFS transporter [Candidatus Dormibacteraeota bacterium]